MADFTFDKHMLAGVVHGNRYERENRSESYVTIPPAFLITDSDGAMWTFRLWNIPSTRGNLEFSVMRNDVDTEEVAKRIGIFEGSWVRIFGHYGLEKRPAAARRRSSEGDRPR